MRSRIKKLNHDPLNDGYLEYGHKAVKRNEHRKKIGTEFKPVGELAFSLVTARDKDYSMAHATESSLDLKVKTRFPPEFNKVKKSSLSCRLEDVEYDVIKCDWDKEKRYLYWYLQEVSSDE